MTQWENLCLLILFCSTSCLDVPQREVHELHYSPRQHSSQAVNDRAGHTRATRSEIDMMSDVLPQGFVYADEMIEGIVVDLKYAGSHNFVGRPIAGYHSSRLIMSSEAAIALNRVQIELATVGLAIKVFDAYRPLKAVNDLVTWAQDLNDTLTKPEYYPHLHKSSLLGLGYIARKSAHSRGSAVDLTLVRVDHDQMGAELDMGTSFDHFGSRSGWATSLIDSTQRKNRELLKDVMGRYGFRSVSGEWWHYVLRKESFPNDSFDFDI